MREWVRAGACRLGVEQIISAVEPRRLNLNITTKGAK
jgi:hypothetical protein